MAYKCLTFEDRRKIEKLYNANKSPQEIAGKIGVTVATIYRELHRGETKDAESGEIKANEHYLPTYNAETAEKRVRLSVRNRGRRRAAR